jgi:hypothetical protein
MSGDAREALRRRQAEVLADLLAGRVPPGFDPATSEVTGRVLRSKRWRAAVAAVPGLRAIGAEAFDDFARRNPVDGCAHADADRFLDWAHRGGRLKPAGRSVRARRLVHSGRRTIALLRHPRPSLLIGVGSRWFELPLGRR